MKTQKTYKMTVYDKWEAILRSIFKAARILNMDLTSPDMPDYQNWFVASRMNKWLWTQVQLKKEA